MNETQPLLETWQILDLLSHLVDKSLVVYEEDAQGRGRYRLLETMRQYGEERLQESGEQHGALSRRHCGRFLEVAEAADARLAGPEQAAALDDLEAEHDNLRAALDGCFCREGDTEMGLRLAANLSEFWATRGHLSEGQHWLALALAQRQDAESEPGEGSPTKRVLTARACALHGAGRLAWHRGEYSVARQHFEEGLQICRTLEDRYWITYLLMWLGNVAFHQADYEAARSLHGEALVFSRDRGDRQGVAYALMWQGNTAYRYGEYAAAAALYQESLATGREVGDLQSVAYCLGNLGRLSCVQGDFEAARAPLRESLQIRQSLGDLPGIVISLENFTTLASRQKRARRAACLMGATEALREALGIPPTPPIGRDEHNGYVASVRAALEEETFTAAWATGRALSRDQAVAYALSEDEENADHA